MNGITSAAAAMSVLRNLESKLAGLVEGTFSRAFKSEVRPVEIARKLAQGDGRAPRAVAVAHLRAERVRRLALARGPQAVRGLRGRARDASCRAICSSTPAASGSRSPRGPTIEFRTDDRLRLGEFGIQARLVRPPTAERGAQPGRRRPHDGLLGLRPARGAAARARSAARPRAPAGRRAAPSCSAPAARCSAARATPTSARRPERLAPPRRGPALGRLVDRRATSARPTA